MSKTKRVHVITKYFFPVAAGIETNIMATYSVLAEKGWDVTIHTSTDTLVERDILRRRKMMGKLRVLRYIWHWYGYMPRIDWDRADVVALHNFNVFPHFFIMCYAMWLKAMKRKKFALILTPHGGFNPEWSIFPRFQSFTKQWYHFGIGTFLINRSVDAMRAVSDWEQREIIKKGVNPEKVVTISNGVEDEAYLDIDGQASPEIREQVQSYGSYIVQIGRIYKIKNYETTIRALTKIPESVNYVIAGPVGDYAYEKYLHSLIKELGLEKRVFFAGVIRGVDKYYLIRHAQMMVHMAVWESFCNVVHEGLSQGLVCIVANNTALPYLIKDGINGYTVETHDTDGVAEKINYVLSHKDTPEVKAMEARNREMGLEMSWRMVAEKMNVLYTSLSKSNLAKAPNKARAKKQAPALPV